MALKRWAVPNCPYKNLVESASNLWTASGSGTNEYFFNQAIFDHEPNAVLINTTVAGKSANAPGSLGAGEWSWGDNDSLGSNTIYIRLLDGADPDSKSSGHIQCSEPVEIIEAEAAKETILLSLLISNYSHQNDARIWVFSTDGTNIIFKWVLDILATSSPFALDSKIVMEPGDKLLIMADIEDVSAIASGDAT